MYNHFYKLSEEDYATLAEKIRESLMTPCYFTGSVECEGAQGERLHLVASLILYRKPVINPVGNESCSTIYEVSAVWWDFVCEGEDGNIEDDFDFDKLCNFIIDRA